MNILLWILQLALALFSFMGGQYKLLQFHELAEMPQTAALSRGVWGAVGVFEMTCAILLIVPAAIKWMVILTPFAAAALAFEALALAVLFARYSLALTATNPLIYVVVMGLVGAFVAYGRFRIRQLA
jgi:hypothetical protein